MDLPAKFVLFQEGFCAEIEIDGTADFFLNNDYLAGISIGNGTKNAAK